MKDRKVSYTVVRVVCLAVGVKIRRSEALPTHSIHFRWSKGSAVNGLSAVLLNEQLYTVTTVYLITKYSILDDNFYSFNLHFHFDLPM